VSRKVNAAGIALLPFSSAEHIIEDGYNVGLGFD